MPRHPLIAVALLGALALPACTTAESANPESTGGGGDLTMAPPGGSYQKVSDLVELPEFVPGLGVLYVDPAALPAGPFLAYDREGNLASTVYMVPMEDLQAQKEFDGLAAGPGEVDHVDLYYNAGHPGVEQPHYHVVLWRISEEEAEALQPAQQ